MLRVDGDFTNIEKYISTIIAILHISIKHEQIFLLIKQKHTDNTTYGYHKFCELNFIAAVRPNAFKQNHVIWKHF